jgi:hypothetical protein
MEDVFVVCADKQVQTDKKKKKETTKKKKKKKTKKEIFRDFQKQFFFFSYSFFPRMCKHSAQSAFWNLWVLFIFFSPDLPLFIPPSIHFDI